LSSYWTAVTGQAFTCKSLTFLYSFKITFLYLIKIKIKIEKSKQPLHSGYYAITFWYTSIYSHLFKGLVNHAPFAEIGWSIWLALLQTKILLQQSFFHKCFSHREFFKLSNRRFLLAVKKPPYQGARRSSFLNSVVRFLDGTDIFPTYRSRFYSIVVLLTEI